MIILMRKVIKMNVRKEKTAKFKSKSKQILCYTFLSINLDITWFMFIIYVRKWSSYFSYVSYVFIALNGSQVSLILLFTKWWINFFSIFQNHREFSFLCINWFFSLNKKKDSQWKTFLKAHQKMELALHLIAKILQTLKSWID